MSPFGLSGGSLSKRQELSSTGGARGQWEPRSTELLATDGVLPTLYSVATVPAKKLIVLSKFIFQGHITKCCSHVI